jgi:tol-pal system protein YbgF
MPSPAPFRVSLAAALAVAAAACARPETAADRQFSELREQVDRMEAERDRTARTDAVPGAGPDDPGAPPPGAALPRAPAPALRVVQLGEPVDADPADPNDPSARPDLRLTGVAGAATPRPRAGKTGARTALEDVEPAEGARPSALDPEAKRASETALAQVQARQYDRGLAGLTAFLTRWPDHPYAENALYWRGEAYFAEGEYLRAAEQFEAVLTRFGSGQKQPDALLKLGMCHERLGATRRARDTWDRLKSDYPRSDAARRIPASSRDPSPKGPKENR